MEEDLGLTWSVLILTKLREKNVFEPSDFCINVTSEEINKECNKNFLIFSYCNRKWKKTMFKTSPTSSQSIDRTADYERVRP